MQLLSLHVTEKCSNDVYMDPCKAGKKQANNVRNSGDFFVLMALLVCYLYVWNHFGSKWQQSPKISNGLYVILDIFWIKYKEYRKEFFKICLLFLWKERFIGDIAILPENLEKLQKVVEKQKSSYLTEEDKEKVDTINTNAEKSKIYGNFYSRTWIT